MKAQDNYGPVAKALHWLVVALLTAQYTIGWLMPDIRPGMTPGASMNLHISIGVVVLTVILFRLAWRLTHRVPPEPTLPRWQRIASEGVHGLLYVLVLATTLAGWIYASMRGWSLSLFSALPLPAIVAKGSPFGRVVGEWHSGLTTVLLIVVGAHVLAALVHLLIYRDRVMQRMLPTG
jgi:cytochrome b561